MLRPNMLALVNEMIKNCNSPVQIGTVINFPEGKENVEVKLSEARKAISDGADDLDFVCNYEAFKEGNIELVKE
jgi:deoxyribose-phosphate aldolase